MITYPDIIRSGYTQDGGVGPVAVASEVKDLTRNKMQSVINAEVQQELGTKLGPTEYNELYDLACAGLVL